MELCKYVFLYFEKYVFLSIIKIIKNPSTYHVACHNLMAIPAIIVTVVNIF